MTITFNTNLSALTAQRYLGIAGAKTSSSLSKLSSGSRVPTAKDDAAALAVGSKLKAEVAGLTQASNNAAQAGTLLQIADGALSTVGDILQRMKALAVQSSSGQLSNSERSLLDQEFGNLNNEIDRIANVTNFNGTSLLSGGTAVSASTNTLGAYSSTNKTSATNLLGSGIQDITFANDYGNGAISIAYDNTGTQVGNLTVTDLVNNKSQTVTLASGAIAAGSTETYNFGELGVSLKLNSNFDKTTDLQGQNTANVDAAAADIEVTQATAAMGTGGGATLATTIGSYSFTGVGANAFHADQLYGAVIAASGAVATVDMANITIGTHTFVNTTGTQNLSTASATGDWTFDDGQGNTFVLHSAVTGTATGTVSGNITIDAATAQGTAGKIENSGSGYSPNRPTVDTFVLSGTAANVFDFGQVDNAKLVLNTATNTAVSASISLNGVTFNTTNSGGATADFSTTGTKTLTLRDANGNGFKVHVNVTQAFNGGASTTAEVDLAQFGQLVGAVSSTTNSTSFDFKVGTGTTNNDKITFSLGSATKSALGTNSLDITTADNANTAITALNTAISTIASRRADVGANQSRLDFASASIAVATQNTTAAQSALMDVDVSAEMTNFTSQQVLLQAGISLLAQANQQPSLLLRLLQ